MPEVERGGLCRLDLALQRLFELEHMLRKGMAMRAFQEMSPDCASTALADFAI
jgi:hypothetical protein